MEITTLGMRMLNAARRLWDLTTEWEQEHREHFGPPRCDSCDRAGCCYQSVVVTPLEGFAIALFINIADVPYLKTDSFLSTLRITGEHMEATARDKWMDKAHGCVFLSGGMCAIYPVRPINCRTYSVLTDPVYCMPSKLRKPGEPTSDDVKTYNNMSLVIKTMLVSIAMLEDFGVADAPFHIRSLPSMVSIMLDAMPIKDDQEFINDVLPRCRVSREDMKNMGMFRLDEETYEQEKAPHSIR